jgi:hypothetical protein
LLAESGKFWTLQGEETPYLRAANVGFVHSRNESDLILPTNLSEAQISFIRANLFLDCGGPGKPSTSTVNFWISQVACRIILQWPRHDWNLRHLIQEVRNFHSSGANQNSSISLIQRFKLEEDAYDFPSEKSSKSGIDFHDPLYEEPPFVLPKLREVPDLETFQSRPLLLKTTTHAYRLPVIRKLFPKARIHYLVLTRHPGASINGLYDGWRSNGFHSHNLAEITKLSIQNYSSECPHGDQWWKFDLPPGWSQYVDDTLESVCAFQWRSAYEHIFKDLESSNESFIMVKHEDIVDIRKSCETMRRLFDFLEIAPDPVPDVTTAPPVMASMPPSPVRWLKRQELFSTLIVQKEVLEINERLKYDLNPDCYKSTYGKTLQDAATGNAH